ncbi:MAG: DeoR/GlpR transcriptional regulator [Clostridia bacterium]|nr:DeoR/GlpR transcriptional regulator [Clostridia bacterium]
MYQKERTDEILKILRNVHYTTVDYLVERIRYSPATIRRDLTLLEKQGLVKRSHGGVEINKESETPFIFRQHSMKSAKSKIAHEAAKLVKDGDVVFLDGSSTVQYVGHFLLEKKDICVVTNNLMLASFLGENGIDIYCAGGKITELPGTASGMLTAHAFSSFKADIMFFSTDGIDENGVITIKPEGYCLHNNAMLKNSKTHVYLCGSDKIGKHSKIVQCDLSEVDYFISDGNLEDKIKNKFSDTVYTTV